MHESVRKNKPISVWHTTSDCVHMSCAYVPYIVLCWSTITKCPFTRRRRIVALICLALPRGLCCTSRLLHAHVYYYHNIRFRNEVSACIIVSRVFVVSLFLVANDAHCPRVADKHSHAMATKATTPTTMTTNVFSLKMRNFLSDTAYLPRPSA